MKVIDRLIFLLIGISLFIIAVKITVPVVDAGSNITNVRIVGINQQGGERWQAIKTE